MTSFMCPFLFLLLIFSSMSAINPPGFKVRITNRALNTLRDEAQAMIQEQVVGKTFERLDFLNVHLRNLRFTEVTMSRVHLQFVENYGFRLVIEDFSFTMNCDSTVNFYLVQPKGSATLAAKGASATMEVGLTRIADGRLQAAMRNCKVSTNRLQIVGTGLPRIVEGALEKLLIHLVCTIINRKGISALNSYLSTAPMVADVFPDLGIKLDYSQTRDIQVTTQSLDMSFKGQAYVQKQPPLMEKGGVEPVFKENNMMAYVGITEFFFNSAARSFYDAGIMSKKFKIKSKIGKAALRIIQFFTQPWNLDKSLQSELKLIEAPTIKITQADGFIFNIRVAGSVISSGSRKPTVLSLSVVCPGSMMITIEGDRLYLPSKDFSCRVESKSVFNKKLNKKINKKIQEFLSDWFSGGWKIPFPDGMNFIRGTVQYQNGFVVVGGDLRFTPAGREKLFNKMSPGT